MGVRLLRVPIDVYVVGGLTSEAWVPLPPAEPDQRAGTFPGDYCSKCGRLAPCAWHPPVDPAVKGAKP